MFDFCVIMAGGSGTRLWPASSSRLPKQFLPASGTKSFFSLAMERALSLVKNSGKVLIITGKSQVPHVITDAAKLPAGEKKRLLVISEPAAKNTAPAIACAVVYSLFDSDGGKNGGPYRNMLVLTSDHIIKPLKVFASDAAAAAAACREKLVVFGIPPVRPETGYGYIETGKTEDSVCDVKAFHEKPDAQTAKKYASGKRFFWNSGMFAFGVQFMAGEFRRLAPDVFQPFEKLKEPKSGAYSVSKGVQILDAWSGLDGAYKKAKSISFDYAIAEKCPNTAMVRTNFDWIDIGNWEEYIKICGNSGSQVFSADAQGCYVDSDIPVALAGVEDLIVVIRSGKNGQPPTALITRKGQTQKVRDIVEQIKKAGKNEII